MISICGLFKVHDQWPGWGWNRHFTDLATARAQPGQHFKQYF